MRTVPLSVWRLMVAYSMMMAGTTLMVLIAGIIGISFAPNEGLATLPIAFVVIGVASSTLPTGRLFVHWGRRRVFVSYGILAIFSALFASWSLVIWSFPAFCLAAFMMGWAGAASHQYRFAALELVQARLAPKATSVLLLGGILAAFVGPEIAVRGRGMLETPFAGSYLVLAFVYGLGVVLVSMNPDSTVNEEAHPEPDRPLSEILVSPVVILAISAAAVAYGVMSFMMTATPISMHQHSGHSLEAAKQVIQSHIIAMYLPSLFFAFLLERFGFRTMMGAGLACLAFSVTVSLAGTAVVNYWLAMILLGTGWNFLFLGGTNMLAFGYRAKERFRVQAMNDFLVFTIQATVSLSSGWVLFRLGWNGLLWLVIPALLVFVLLLWRSHAFAMVAPNTR